MKSIFPERLAYGLLGIACAAAITFGIFARFQGLDDRPYATDEYYWITSVNNVAADGVPHMPSGGYYSRTLGLQYLEAGLVKAFGDTELVHRLPATLFGILILPLFFAYARQFSSVALALVGTALLAVSSWEIEFSRFARMYAAFQFFVLAFLLVHHLVYRKGRHRLRFLPPILALVTIMIQPLGILFVPLLFTPILRNDDRENSVKHLLSRWREVIPGILVLLGGLCWLKFGDWLWSYGALPRYPPGFAPWEPADRVLLPLIPALKDPMRLVAFLGSLTGIVWFAILAAVRWDISRAVIPGALAVMFITGVFHLLIPFSAVLAVLVLRYDFHRTLWTSRRTATAFILACLPAVAWLVWALANREWLDTAAPGGFFRSFRLVFLSVPDLYIPGIHLWLRTMPGLAILVGACVAWELIRLRRQPLRTILESPAFLLPFLLCFFGLKDSWADPTTRYWFMIYPSMLLVVIVVFAQLAQFVRQNLSGLPARLTPPVFVGILVGLFCLSKDFNLPVITKGGSPDVTFRMGTFASLEAHWYPRYDVRTPAQFVNAHTSPSTQVIVSGRFPAVAHYLNPGVGFAYYLPRDFKLYSYLVSSHGERERWTGRQLLGTQAELSAYTVEARDVFLVRRLGLRVQECDPESLWPMRWRHSEVVSVSRDDRIEVLHVQLAAPNANVVAASRPLPAADL